jgi:hypothetical protein
MPVLVVAVAAVAVEPLQLLVVLVVMVVTVVKEANTPTMDYPQVKKQENKDKQERHQTFWVHQWEMSI